MKTGKTNSENATGLEQVLRALRHRNYRLFFGGQSISVIGTWMQRIAMSWLVYRLTNSAFLLGLVGFTSQIPIFLLTPFAGVLADRSNRHHILVVTQTMAMIQAFTLAFLVLTGTIAVWHIIALSIVLGVIDAFDMPTRQSFVVEMIEDRGDLGNAIALSSSMVHSGRLIGPSLAGILVAYIGEGMCFLLNAISYIAVILSLLAMKMRSRKIETSSTHMLQELSEGFSYAFSFAPIRSVLLLITLVSAMGSSYMVLMPVFAKDILQGDSHTLGFLMGCTGLGALLGAGYLASRKSVLGLEKWIILASSIAGVALILFSMSRFFWFSMFLLLLSGFGIMVQHTSGNTLLQMIVDEDKRGRVMSLFIIAFKGMTPFGNLLVGVLASYLGAPNTIVMCGASCMLGSLIFAKRLSSWRKMVRPIYIKKGIISETLS